MASQMSMSESFQASIIYSQQISKQFPQTPTLTPEKRVPYRVQILLVAALFGVEMCMAFEQIYMVLILQYLSTPVSMVSLNGVICGATSVLFMPLIGWLTDRGPNPKIRKMFSLSFGMCTFFLGTLLLITCGLIKINSSREYYSQLTRNSSTDILTRPVDIGTTAINVDNTTVVTQLPGTQGTTAQGAQPSVVTLGPSVVKDSELPVTVYLSILGFACLDIGYDVSMSTTRAFVLTCVPPEQHTSILMTATIVQSSAGVAFSLIGIFDFPSILEQAFGVEGIAATLILFTSLLLFTVLLTFSSTIITGYLYHADPAVRTNEGGDRFSSNSLRNRQDLDSKNRIAQDEDFFLPQEESKIQRFGSKKTQRPYIADILHTEEGDTATRPLLLEDSLNISNYAAVSSANPSAPLDSFNQNEANTYENQSQTFRGPSYQDFQAFPNNIRNRHDQDREMQNTENENPIAQDFEPEMIKEKEVASEQESSSTSFAADKAKDLEGIKCTPPQAEQTSNRKRISLSFCPKISRRMAVLLCSTFFAMGAMLSYVEYVANSLTIGVYHGDPEAPPGSQGKQNYEDGLRTAALGNMVLYIVYFVLSMSNAKLIQLIGEKLQYLVGSLLFIVFNVTFTLGARTELYFASMAAAGTYRTCVFTVLFVLANKFAHDTQQDDSNSNGDRPKATNIGQIMSLVGVLLPVHFLLLSAILGPLMDVTGDVFVPLKYSAVTASASLLVFCMLFFIKK